MKTVLAVVFAFLVASIPLHAAETLVLKQGDTIQKLLEGQKGKKVTIRTHGGEEFTGKLTFVSKELVQLEELSRREFFDAVIDLSKIEAVIVRVRDK